MKSIRKVFNVAAEKPKKLQITSSQFIIALFIICSFNSSLELLKFISAEQLIGPFKIFCSIPTCQIE